MRMITCLTWYDEYVYNGGVINREPGRMNMTWATGTPGMNGLPTFTKEQARTLRRQWKSQPEGKYSVVALARQHGVSLRTMTQLLHGVTYRNVGEWTEDEEARIEKYGEYPRYYNPKTKEWSMP